MKGLRILGEYLLEIVVIILLGVLSALTVIGFVPMLVGFTAFFSKKKDERLFKDIFKAIASNWRILIPYTIFQIVIVVVPVLNIVYFNNNPKVMNPFFLAISYVALVVGAMYLTCAPTIIVNMEVGFFQLLRNGIMLLFGGPIRSLAGLGVVAGTALSIVYFPYITIPLIYVSSMLVSILMKENFLHLKAKALGTNVYELKKRETDDYVE